MKKIKSIIILSCFVFPLSAQISIQDILELIERNNTTLIALKEQAEADKINNKTGIYLENPEIEFHYLWGNKDLDGNRVDFTASQSFDFPTAYYYRKKLAKGKNEQIDLQYLVERKKILLEAKQLCIELVYCNAFIKELDMRLQHANQIAEANQIGFDKGEINILDLNKAKLSLLNANKEYNIFLSERDQMLAELKRLNGNVEIDFSEENFYQATLPPDFEIWFKTLSEDNLILRSIEQDIELSKKNEKLQRSLNLPKFSAGYMSEKVADEHFQGVMVGISIPLWENKNTIRQIKAQTNAFKAMENDASMKFYNQMKSLYEKASKLYYISESYKENLSLANSSVLLKKALDMGEISLIDYIMELGLYYEAVNNVLEAQRDYCLIMAELEQWSL